MILLIDIDSRTINPAVAKLSRYYKEMGEQVILANFNTRFDVNKPNKQPLFLNIPIEFFYAAEKVFCSLIFSANRKKVEYLLKLRPDIDVGGVGWDLFKNLPDEIERLTPDYNLYDVEFISSRIRTRIAKKEGILKKAKMLCDMGVGFTARGCIYRCEWCLVHRKEGLLHQVSEISNLINPRSRNLSLLDNNFTADPLFQEKASEIIQRGLRVNFTQGLSIKYLSELKAYTLSKIKRFSNIYYAWDEVDYEAEILKGIRVLSKYIAPSNHRCYMLVNFNSTFEEDYYRYKKLVESGVDPYVMVYRPLSEEDHARWLKNYPLAQNELHQKVVRHFARYVNGYFFKSPLISSFNDYAPIREIGFKFAA